MRIRLPSRAPPIAAALWVARHVSVFLPSCYTTWGDTTGQTTCYLNRTYHVLATLYY